MWMELKRWLWQWRGVIIATPCITALVLGVRESGLLQGLELTALDVYFFARPSLPIDDRIVVVSINESDVQKIGEWPMPDATLAQLLLQVKQQQPRVIGLDLYRDLMSESKPGSAQLLQIFESTPNLIGIRKVVSSGSGQAVNPPAALAKRDQVAANDFVLDGDGKLRRHLLSLRTPEKKTILSLGAILAVKYLEAKGIQLEPVAKTSQLKLGKAQFQRWRSNDGGYVQIDSGGYQILATFQGLRRKFQILSMTDVLEGRIPQDSMQGRIVLIGVVAESAADFFNTPNQNWWWRRTEDLVPGVILHADLCSQILSSAIEGQPLIQSWDEWVEKLWILGWSLIGATLSWMYRYHHYERRSSHFLNKLPLGFLTILGCGIALIGGGYFALITGWWIPVIPALLTLFGSAIAITGYTARTADKMRWIFGRYLTDEVVANLLEQPDRLRLGGEKRTITLLMSDLRGFSAFSEHMTPEEAVRVINRYLATMTDVVQQYGGTINEIIGDGIFVMFGAPILQEDHAQCAIACAIKMQLALAEMNTTNQSKEWPKLEMGIGINTGEVLIGNIGSEKRAKFTAMGSPVNLASRVESYTVGGQILITKETLVAAGPIVKVKQEFHIHPKGIQEKILIYEVSGIEGAFNLKLPEQEDCLISLNPAIPVQYTVLLGKQTEGLELMGELVKISETGAELRSSQPLKILSDLKLNLIGTKNETELGDLYAKVVGHLEPDSCRIRFTAVPSKMATILQNLQN